MLHHHLQPIMAVVPLGGTLILVSHSLVHLITASLIMFAHQWRVGLIITIWFESSAAELLAVCLS
jgi:hypothetical protein